MNLKACVSLVFLVLLLSGCVSLQAVQDYSASSHQTLENVKPIAKDFYGSCLRSNSYKPLSQKGDCEKERSSSKAVEGVLSALDAYVVALGAMASGEVANFDLALSQVADAVNRGDALDKNKVDSITKLSALIAGTATRAYQQKKVVEFIRTSNDSVTAVSEMLAELLKENYVQSINMELTAWQTSYRGVEKAQRGSSVLEWQDYSRKQWEINAQLESRKTVAMEMAISIRDIGKMHSKLEADAEQLDADEVIAAVRGFVVTAKPVIADVQQAFAK